MQVNHITYNLEVAMATGTITCWPTRTGPCNDSTLNPEKAPPPEPPILAFLRAGPSSPSLSPSAVVSGLVSGKATRILRGLLRSTMGWKFAPEDEGGCFGGASVGVSFFCCGSVTFSRSESEASESE